MAMDDAYREGKCRTCGMRVTVAGQNDSHVRDGRECGPVETEHPFRGVSDDPPGTAWMIPWRADAPPWREK